MNHIPQIINLEDGTKCVSLEDYDMFATEHMLSVNKICNERDEAREDLAEETKFHHRTHSELIKTACELMDVKTERDDLREVLSEISLYLSVGMGDETTTAKQYHDRILEGIKMLTDPIMENWKKSEKELDEAIGALLKIDEIYIDGDDTYEDRIKMGEIAREVLDKIYLKNESRIN